MGDPDEEELYNPIVYERDDTPPTAPDSGWTARPAPAVPWWTPALSPERATRTDVTRTDVTRTEVPRPVPAPPVPGPPVPPPPRPAIRPVSQDPSWPPRLPEKRRPPRWLLAAVAALLAAAAAGGTAFALAGSPAARSSGLTPPLTPAGHDAPRAVAAYSGISSKL